MQHDMLYAIDSYNYLDQKIIEANQSQVELAAATNSSSHDKTHILFVQDMMHQQDRLIEYINAMGEGLMMNKDYLYYSKYCPAL